MGVPCSAGGYGAAQITCVSLNNGLCAITPPPPPPCPCVAAYRVGGNYADCETDYYSWNPATSRYESPRILRQICSGVCQTLNEECGSGIHWGETATSCVTTNGPCSMTPAPTPAPTPLPTPAPTPRPTPAPTPRPMQCAGVALNDGDGGNPYGVYPNGLCARYETDTGGSICVTDTETLAIRQRSLAAGLPAGKPYCATRNGTYPTNMMYLAGGCNIRIDCSYCGGCERWPLRPGESEGYCVADAACDNYPGCYGYNMHFQNHIPSLGMAATPWFAYLCTNPALTRFEDTHTGAGTFVVHYVKDAEGFCGNSGPIGQTNTLW